MPVPFRGRYLALLPTLCLAAGSTFALAGSVLLVDQKPGRSRSADATVVPSQKRAGPPTASSGKDVEQVRLTGPWERSYDLTAGKIVEISVHIEKPSALPPNGRIAAEWTLQGTPSANKERIEPNQPTRKGPRLSAIRETPPARPAAQGRDAIDVYTNPTPNWRKVLHALDGDIYVVYRAPVAGKYTLKLYPVTNEQPVGAGPRWREKGGAPDLAPIPNLTPWPAGMVAPVAVSVKPLSLRDSDLKTSRTVVEFEPNDTPEQAQPMTLTAGEGVQKWEVTGGADDVEYFDNGRVGRSGDDWYRLEYTGTEPRLLTAQLSMPGQVLAARVRAYKQDGGKDARGLLAVSEYFGRKGGKAVFNENKLVSIEEGRDANERTHQQDEEHRANVTRLLYPGETYFLRVEANSPGYQLQIRLVKPAPYDDPRMAVRQAMYMQVGQVDAWLTNRPRGASVERRIRDSGNLMGTNCMSCHTQSGVWGPAVPIQNGYRLENVLNYWHMQNVMYECLRPTNVLKDAANNTSLAPLDLGDGPAGTRAAGFNIATLERIRKPNKLHSSMQIRTANYVLQTNDPGGINAAAAGSNVGQAVVYWFSADILKTAWEKTGEPRYFRKMEEKANRIMAVQPKFLDDIAFRLDFFHRLVPIDQYEKWTAKAAEPEKTKPADVSAFVAKVKAQLVQDEARLRALQLADGSWGFSPGSTPDGGKTWTGRDSGGDPAPTALGIYALTSAGHGKGEPAIANGVKALLGMQDASGRWNKAAITGFVTTAYALHALSRLYPEKPYVPQRAEFTPKPGERLLDTIDRVRAMALTGDARFVDLMVKAASHESPQVRYWAVIGLGGTHTRAGVPALIAASNDRTKMVRDAAAWALRQTLLDDKGWDAVYAALQTGGDYSRECIAQALNMRADAVMPKSVVNWNRLTALLDRGMNADPHPAVRAWSAKAAWQWWVWNPPVRKAVNTAWMRMLERPEANALVENANRYSSQALFIANGHKANGSSDHQYKELADLFDALSKRLDAVKDPVIKARLARRLVGIGGTFFETAGGDGGPGQMGYVTPNSGEMMGKAVLAYLAPVMKKNDLVAVKAGIEGGANVPYSPLTEVLVNYSLKGPEELRRLAASAVSDPRSVSLAAVPELVEPQLAQIKRGAMDPPRRAQISDPIVDLWSKVNWAIPKTEEQQRAFFNLIIPKFDRYVSPAEIAAMTDASKKAEAEREMSAAWYLADRLGEVLQKNPDLHHEIVFHRYFPKELRNPLEVHYWLRSVEWLLTYGPVMGMPQSGVKTIAFQEPAPKQDDAKPDETLTIKDRALQVYLDAVKPTANPRTRDIALRMANQTALRTNPEVLRALAEVLPLVKDEELRKLIDNVLKQTNEKFMPELVQALKAEKHPSVQFANGEPALTKEQTEDIVYFRDYVMPELSRQKRSDQQSCLGCHGVSGRVPPFTLTPPDKFGYIAVKDLLSNYRVVQQKVNLSDLERSKMLRKPLNIQDGKEDGHQGGRRYGPMDEGYLVLKKWVENQPAVLKPVAKPNQASRPTSPVNGETKQPMRSSQVLDRFPRRYGASWSGTPGPLLSEAHNC
jgi:hypothetical protein